MKRWLIRSVQVAALAMGGLALTGTAAHADSWNSGPNVGFFNGNQSSTTIQTPVNICGNSLAIIGFASANCNGGAYAVNGGGSYSGAGYNGRRNGDGGANALGVSNNRHRHHHHRNGNGGANAASYDDRGDYGRGNGGGGAYAYNNDGDHNTGWNIGIGNGNQSSFTYQAPINVSCNSTALIGFASSC
ncbi:chaplin family protein [Dactylosporangium sp. CS-033363]|uniref:chaplin family protein n=1 Tax=Dactylosporangium sp. CS-033363 TaxID=3239935 RepID=UPI003D937B16